MLGWLGGRLNWGVSEKACLAFAQLATMMPKKTMPTPQATRLHTRHPQYRFEPPPHAITRTNKTTTHLREGHARALARQPRVLAQERVLPVHRQEVLWLDVAQDLLELVLGVVFGVACLMWGVGGWGWGRGLDGWGLDVWGLAFGWGLGSHVECLGVGVGVGVVWEVFFY